MRQFLLWIEFGKSCKCGDKSNYLAAGTVGGNIPGVESPPWCFMNLRSCTAQTQNCCFEAALSGFKAKLRSFKNPKQCHFETAQCGFKGTLRGADSTPGMLPRLTTIYFNFEATLSSFANRNSADLKPHCEASKPYCAASRTQYSAA